ncbi:hypothetical protein [Desulfatiferula olefinivorans]
MADRKLAIVPTMTLSQSYLVDEAYDDLPPAYRTPEIRAEREDRAEYFNRAATAHCDSVLHEQNMIAMTLYRKLGWDNL